MPRERKTSFPDRVFNGVSVALTVLLGLAFTSAGVTLSLRPIAQIGRIANLLVADIFLTLGITSLVGVLAWCFPRAPLLRALADNMFKKLCVLAIVLAIVCYVVLIFM